MARGSFIFYASFAQAASMLGDKARLKLYDSVVKLGLCCAENETELNQVCADIETSLIQNRNVLAQFMLIKPQIITNFKKFLGGNKGKEFGVFGGAPQKNKNASKKQPLLLNENVNANANANANANVKEGNSVATLSGTTESYAFEGVVIKLKQKDFNNWEKAYPDLNLYAECVVRDGWLSTQPEAEQKRWFMSTAAYFAKQNEKRKKQHEAETELNETYGDYL